MHSRLFRRSLSLSGRLAATLGAIVGFCAVSLSPAHAQTPVALELSLVVDVSGSVSLAEYNLQMDGYANAFRDPLLQSFILGAPNGIAVNMIQFASNAAEVVPWTVVQTAADANALADVFDTLARSTVVGSGTEIFDGVNLAVSSINSNTFISVNRPIIDVSGDGTSNTALTQAARDNAASSGIIVNGIAIGGTSITNFYDANVRTADGVVFSATDFTEFQAGVLQKLRLEVGSAVSAPEPGTLALLAVAGTVLGVAHRRHRSA